MARRSGDDKQIPQERSAEDYLPKEPTLDNLRSASKRCRGCDLFKDATQTVFGSGADGAVIMFIGEQPGDAEDKAGVPFVGPAGRLLRKAMLEAGIPEDAAYFTNAVKHFKYQWRGPRRLHAKPRRIEVEACLPWLLAEIASLQPAVIVCLGATAAQALFGTSFRLTQHRGQFLASELAPYVMATIHPSAILRAPDSQSRREQLAQFTDELRLAWEKLSAAR